MKSCPSLPLARRHLLPILAVGVGAMIPVTSDGALVVTNGIFGVTNRNAQTVDAGGWFESTITTNWVEGSWSNAIPPTFPAGSGMALLMDGGGPDLGYIYQSLGTVSLADIAAGTLRITSDFAEKQDGATNDARFDILIGNSFTGSNGLDILSGGLVSLGSFTLNAAAQGLTSASGDASRAAGVLVGSVNISGLNAGDQVWLRIGESRLPSFITGDLIVDNVSVAVIPEPSSVFLAAFGIFGMTFVRRRA